MRVAPFRLLIALTFLLPLPINAQQGAPRSARNANYTITAQLDAANRTLDGEGRLLWRNTTTAPTSELRLHLYWNAWRDADSTWMRGQQWMGNQAVLERPAVDPGSIQLTALRVMAPDGPIDVLDRVRFIAPDDDNQHDRTVASIDLDQPIPPGHDVTLEMRWTARIPRTYDRTGVLGNTFFIAQWFPKAGVLQEDGWRAAQFHAHTEFFADFGVYDVSLTVPTGWTVGATGREASRDDHGNGTTTHRYLASDVHDFAWTTSPDYIEHRDRFEAPDLPAVDVRLLLRPDHASQAARHLTAARTALAEYGRRLGPFPWPNLTIVDPIALVNPRAQGGRTEGMEYPTLFTAGTSWFDRWADDWLESTIVHEIGHQYLQSAAANNEVVDAWLDEGLTSFLTGQIIEDAFPSRFTAVDRYFGGLVTWRQPDVRWSRLHQGYYLDAYRETPGWDASTTPTWQQVPRTSAVTVYSRTPLALETIARVIGPDMMATVLATYYARGAFRHPTPEDFFAIASSTAGRDLSWLFDTTLQRSSTFDYAVGEVAAIRTSSSPDRFESRVIIERRADGVFPVEVRVAFDDGHIVLERWNDDGTARWQAFSYDRPARVSKVEVDPDRVLVLDVHRTNNSWTAEPRAAEVADRWTRRWLAWAQHVLMTYAFFV